MSIICNLELEDLKRSNGCEPGMSGAKAVYVSLHEDVKSFPTLPLTRTSYANFAELNEGGIMLGTKDHSIEMKPGKNFIKFYSGKNLGELKYAMQGVSGGKSFQANLELVHPKTKSDILGFLGATMNRELVLLVELFNGDIHMLGDKDTGVEYGDSIEVTSGKAKSDQSGATINFVYDTPTAQIYLGDIEGLLAVEEGSMSPSSST